MKGKKVDVDFLSSFILDCTSKNKNSAEEILKEANYQISIIDKKIKEIDSLKKNRCKLVDVVSTFNERLDKSLEAKNLHFFDLKKKNTCNEICRILKEEGVIYKHGLTESLGYIGSTSISFCVKQLLEFKIIVYVGSDILKGPEFEDYMNFKEKQ